MTCSRLVLERKLFGDFLLGSSPTQTNRTNRGLGMWELRGFLSVTSNDLQSIGLGTKIARRHPAGIVPDPHKQSPRNAGAQGFPEVHRSFPRISPRVTVFVMFGLNRLSKSYFKSGKPQCVSRSSCPVYEYCDTVTLSVCHYTSVPDTSVATSY